MAIPCTANASKLQANVYGVCLLSTNNSLECLIPFLCHFEVQHSHQNPCAANFPMASLILTGKSCSTNATLHPIYVWSCISGCHKNCADPLYSRQELYEGTMSTFNLLGGRSMFDVRIQVVLRQVEQHVNTERCRLRWTRYSTEAKGFVH